jgi:hypothetical protein
MAALDRIVMTQIVEYIIANNIIQDNFEVSLALYINQAISDSNEATQVRNNIAIPLDSVIKDGILNFLCEWVDNIVEPLYNDGECFLTSTERLLISNDGFCIWDIIRFVYRNCREYDNVNAMEEYLEDYNWDKMFDLYMYFRAKNILFDVNGDNDFVEYIDPLVEIYKEEIKKRHIIEVSKQISIAKIKRNSLYNLGLGLKLSKLQYAKDFA